MVIMISYVGKVDISHKDNTKEIKTYSLITEGGSGGTCTNPALLQTISVSWSSQTHRGWNWHWASPEEESPTRMKEATSQGIAEDPSILLDEDITMGVFCIA